MKKRKTKKKVSDINVPNSVSTAKLKTFFIIILLLIILMLGRVGFIKFVDGDNLKALATSQQTLTETISAKRGTIYDVNGVTLAMSYETDKIYVNPSSIEDENKEIVANGLANIIELDYQETLDKITSNTNRFVLASDVDQEKVKQLKEWISDLNENKVSTGISFEETTSREYPRGSLASTIIGFTGTDNKGSYGIEYSWDSFLSGTAGKSVSLKDASQSEIANSEKTYIAAENGYDINLTIDAYIQDIIEKDLAEAVDEYKCDSGITIAMDPSTGKILALADYPNYDCNNHNTPNSKLAETWDSMDSSEKTTSLFRMWTPKAVNDTYEPGSVFKLITSSIALEENLVETDKRGTFVCTGAFYIKGESTPIRCWSKTPHGAQSLREALMHSCNPAFMELGLKIGSKRSYKYYEAFGLFEKTGISLSGEAIGQFYDLNTINEHELATMSFGERFTITPIQMITAVSAIANDGVLVQPQLVDRITNTDTGEVTEFKTKEVRQVISKSTADKVASMMESVVSNDGSGRKAQVAGYSIGGKTGTSEPRANTDEGYTASFVAISPVENTKVVLLVILKNPGEGVNHNGGIIAAPTASKMLSKILPYLGVEYGNKTDDSSAGLSDDEIY